MGARPVALAPAARTISRVVHDVRFQILDLLVLLFHLSRHLPNTLVQLVELRGILPGCRLEVPHHRERLIPLSVGFC